MIITRLMVKNYQGIATLEIDVPPAGGIFEGSNGTGKTSAIDAIFAALVARGIGAENVRVGAERAEILINLDDVHVRRVIRGKGGTDLAVSPDEGLGAAGRLKTLLKASAIDPLLFYLAKPDERQRLVLDAMPVQVTHADLERWCGESRTDIDVSKHGIEVLKGLRKEYEIRRATANRVVKETKMQAEVAAQKALEAMMKPGADSKVPVPVARAAMEDAAKAHARLVGVAEGEKKSVQAGEATRTKVAALRSVCTMFTSYDAANEALSAAREEVVELKRKLQKAADYMDVVDRERIALATADSLGETLKASGTATVTDADIDRAAAIVAVTETQFENAKLAEVAARAESDKGTAEGKVDEAVLAAAALDRALVNLREVAPAELAARNDSIPGFDFEAMTLDGIPIATLNSAKQLEFAVSLAKRMSTGVKTLVVDGLERLDREQLPRFLKMATADGWQLLGTQVSDGQELVFHAMEDVLAGEVIK